MHFPHLFGTINFVLAEQLLALMQPVLHFSDESAQFFFFKPRCHTTNVRQFFQVAEPGAGHVHNEEVDLFRGVRQRRRGDQGAQHGGLAGLRRAEDGHVAAGSGEVDGHGALPLFHGLVFYAQWEFQVGFALYLESLVGGEVRPPQHLL